MINHLTSNFCTFRLDQYCLRGPCSSPQKTAMYTNKGCTDVIHGYTYNHLDWVLCNQLVINNLLYRQEQGRDGYSELHLSHVWEKETSYYLFFESSLLPVLLIFQLPVHWTKTVAWLLMDGHMDMIYTSMPGY